MTREEKIIKRKLRAKTRKEKRNKKYFSFLEDNRDVIRMGGFAPAKKGGRWFNSSTGKYMQVCSYDAYGSCESPCNGDC